MANQNNYSSAQIYEEVSVWEPLKGCSLEQLLKYTSAENEAFSSLYQHQEAQHFPLRRNGDEFLTHPINVAHFLQKAKADYLTVISGLLHDFIEDSVSKYEKSPETGELRTIEQLDLYEGEVISNLHQEVNNCLIKCDYADNKANMIMEVVTHLTRHKRHRYYRSIAGIFHGRNEDVKKREVQVKLADRMHNILTLGNYFEEDKIYQCFKNVFILNNAKRYLHHQKEISDKDVLYTSEENTTQKLFHKCCKATYSACLSVYNFSLNQGIREIEGYIQLFFEKYNQQIGGLWGVNEWNDEREHPSKLYDGIIRKYDAQLHGERDEFQRRENLEIEFCQEFFFKHHFNSRQLKAIIHAKDAHAIKAIIGMLLYDKNYTLKKFECSQLCNRGRKCFGELEEETIKGL
jgi:hypothetical protein